MKFHDNLSLMTWHARPDMSCDYVNRAWLEFTGYTTEEALGDGWTRCLHPEDLPRWLETSVRAFDERTPFEIEYRMRRHDGEYRWVHERAAPRYGEDGQFAGFGGACVDIQARKGKRNGSPRAQGPLLAGIRVLVVGREHEACQALVKPLEVAGADVRVAADSVEALQTVGSWHPNVLLSARNEGFIRANGTELAEPVEPVALLATVKRLAA